MIELELRPAREQPPIAAQPYRRIAWSDGSPWALYYRVPPGYLLRFPSLADFEIDADLAWVTCQPAPHSAPESCRQVFLNHVRPAILGARGKCVVHASCVEIGGGAVLFLGDTGRGKSTLAASFAREGHAFLSDDGILLEPAGPVLYAHPGEPWLRLWEDSEAAVLGSGCAVGGSKARIGASATLAYCPRPLAVRSAYLLGEDRREGVAVVRLGQAEAFLAWAGQSFLLDTEDRTTLAAHFDGVARLANRLECHRLDYPRRYDALDLVRRAVVERLEG